MEKPPATCPLESCLKFLAGAWTPKILWYLRGGPRRFGELKRDLDGVSAKVLTTRLRELEERGVVTRKVLPTSPPMVEYRLTGVGLRLQPVLDAIVEVGRELEPKRKRASTPGRNLTKQSHGLLAPPLSLGRLIRT